MKINLNRETSNNQNFGMAIHSNPTVNRVIKSRIKTSKEIEKLNKIIEREAKNDFVDITLLVNPNGKSLSANAYIATDKEAKFNNIKVFKQFSENKISEMFGGVVGFIEKVAKYADKQAIKMKEYADIPYDDVLDKMK